MLLRPIWVSLELEDQHLDLPLILPYPILLPRSLTAELAIVVVLRAVQSLIKIRDFASLLEPSNRPISVFGLAPERDPRALLLRWH